MTKNRSRLLPAGTVLTTEGKDKILTGKLQRDIVWFLSDNWQPSMKDLLDFMRRVHGTPRQNVYRTVKALEEKGVLLTVQGAKGSTEIYHAIEVSDDGSFVVDADVEENFRPESKAPGGAVVSNLDFVAAIRKAFDEKNPSAVFKTLKKARSDSGRWFIVSFNKPSLYTLAANAFHRRVDLLGLLDAFGISGIYDLVEQAARGAWQPFFDTLKKNKVISYHDLPEGRVMVWDARCWSVYSARVMQQREAIIHSWETE
ncbi:TPA: hypothetical protein RUX66_004154 [Aeromonas dhakensis]|uniref:hypothetical protein n=1 Tax=Aeromonas dhakensis TaxID=196024 RepID=UPI000371C65C|nr:hypothetical protein [Aeromonas dhakensis]MBL0636109.1 hypothetical protein [Aeromonas dhakensis]HDZ8911328.1 hypothetical protein [Aeromonas dhakensis]